MALTLDSPVSAIDRRLAERRMGVKEKGPPAAEVLAGIEIHQVRDLLHHYPRRYIDRSQVARIRDLRIGQHATVIARVTNVQKRRTRHGRILVTIRLYDGSGYLELSFFNQPWLATTYRAGVELAVTGVAQRYGRKLQMANQEVEPLRGDEHDLVHMGRITPIHRATEGISTRTIRELVWRALEQIPALADPLPASIVRAESLSDFDRAIRWIHFPDSPEELDGARDRLKFDELFALELGVAFRKHRVERAEQGVAHPAGGPLVDRLLATLP